MGLDLGGLKTRYALGYDISGLKGAIPNFCSSVVILSRAKYNSIVYPLIVPRLDDLDVFSVLIHL